MYTTQPITDALFSYTRAKLLGELLRASGEGRYLRELARLTGLNVNGVRRELMNLESAGIVVSERIGRQVNYRLNERCPIYLELKMMIVKTVGLADALREALAPLAGRVKLAYLYGSFAGGTAGPDSDVDLMVVGEVSLREVSSALMEAGRKLGRELNPTVFPEGEYAEALAEGEGFVHDVHFGPRVMLLGEIDDAK